MIPAHGEHVVLLIGSIIKEMWTSKNSLRPQIPGYTSFHIPGRYSTGRSAGRICVCVFEGISHLVQQCGDQCTAKNIGWTFRLKLAHQTISVLEYAFTPQKGLFSVGQQMDRIKIPLPHERQIWNISETKEMSLRLETLKHGSQT